MTPRITESTEQLQQQSSFVQTEKNHHKNDSDHNKGFGVSGSDAGTINHGSNNNASDENTKQQHHSNDEVTVVSINQQDDISLVHQQVATEASSCEQTKGTSSSSSSKAGTVALASSSSSLSSSSGPFSFLRLCNTFHWELNLYTFLFLFFLTYVMILEEEPQYYRTKVRSLLLLYVLFDSSKYYYYKGTIPGCPYTFPFVSTIAMVIRPVRFWKEMANIAMENKKQMGMCTNVLGIGKFMVFVTDNHLCRKILTGEGTYQVFAHPNAYWLFDEKNLIYMTTEPHKKFRAILTPALFSNEAITAYAQIQENVCRMYLRQFAKEIQVTNQPLEARIAFRKMAAATSQEAFLGPYLTDSLREQLEKDIMEFTAGFLCFPFPYGNTGLHRAIQAKNRIEAIVEKMVPQAMAYAKSGQPSRCLMERWAVSIITTANELQLDDPNRVPYCDEKNMGRTILDFLFAAQDATNSALAYALDVLDAHPVVFEKMRSEILSVCGSNHTIATKIRDGCSLPYTMKVANALLHHKPPVPMIPYIALKPSQLGGHSIPTGTIVIPSIMYSARTSGRSVTFDPDCTDDTQFVQTIVFGGGQHKCPGRRYGETLVSIFIAILAQEYTFHRINERPGVDDFVYYPTVFPADCYFHLEYNPPNNENTTTRI